MIRFALAAVLLVPPGLAVCGTAAAQQAQPAATTTNRCGGVLCDLYYRDVPPGAPSPTALPCHDFVCGMFGGRTPDAPPAEQMAQAPEPAAQPAKPARKKKHIAKAKADVQADAAPSMPAAK